MSTRLKGKRFRYPLMETDVLWEVKSSRGRGVFECEAVNEPQEYNGKVYDSDFAGYRKVFAREEIEASLKRQAFFDALRTEHEDFYEGLKPGQVVHYNHGGGAYIRGEVVVVEASRHDLDHPYVKEGEKALKIVALVGDWRSYDLHPDGYHVKRIGHVFKPNSSCIWENPTAPCRNRDVDPTLMIPLQIPKRGGSSGIFD